MTHDSHDAHEQHTDTRAPEAEAPHSLAALWDDPIWADILTEVGVQTRAQLEADTELDTPEGQLRRLRETQLRSAISWAIWPARSEQSKRNREELQKVMADLAAKITAEIEAEATTASKQKKAGQKKPA